MRTSAGELEHDLRANASRLSRGKAGSHFSGSCSALVDRDHAPAIFKAIDPRQRQRVDHESQRAVGRKIERDGEHGADGAGMHDENASPAGSEREPCPRARDLVDKTFAAGRPVAGRRFPELLVGLAEFGDEIVVPPPGPFAKVLFAKRCILRRIEPQPARAVSRVRRAGLQTAKALVGSLAFSAAKAATSPRSAGASGAWMTPRGPSTGAWRISQRSGFGGHHGQALRRAAAGSRSPRPARRHPAHRRSGRRSAAGQPRHAEPRSGPRQARPRTRWSMTMRSSAMTNAIMMAVIAARRIGLAGIAGQPIRPRIGQIDRHRRQYAASQRVRGDQAGRHSRPGTTPARKALRQSSPAGSARHRCRAGCRA